MRKTLFGAATIIVFAISASSVSAATLSELQEQLRLLTSQIAAIQSQSTAAKLSNNIGVCPKLTRNLSRGTRGDDVGQLQQFLISQNFFAPDSATSFFGSLTETAVKKLQCNQNLICSGTAATTGYGAVGPKTRAAIANLCRNNSSDSKSTISTIPAVGSSGGISNGAGGNTGSGNSGGASSVGDGTNFASCVWNGQSVNVGASITAYQSSSVSAGSSCVSESRICSNGNLSGSYQYASCAVTSPPAQSTLPPLSTTGWIGKISTGDGVMIGWAADKNNPQRSIPVNFYTGGTASTGGTLVGTMTAQAIDFGVNWSANIAGLHGFSFYIPDVWRDGVSHTLFAQPVDTAGRIGDPIGTGAYSFTLSPSSKNIQQPVTDTHCLDPNSRCPSNGNDYLAPNYPTTSGWGESKNYFTEWGCTSSVGINYIARLNIIPHGTHGPQYANDSISVNDTDVADAAGDPWIFFTSSSFDHGSVYGLKKADYEVQDNSWHVYSVLDNPQSSGGLSSQDGRGVNILMNDYSLPGWGPSSPTPGSQNKIPGVSDTSAGTQIPSYPLIGSGPLGITTIINLLQPPIVSGGPEGRTCIHMNPKLLDYDVNGRPHTLIANLWQNTVSQACKLPPGAPVAQLPAPGNYLYRYAGPDLGWQLDLGAGLITDSHYDTTNAFALTPKLLLGSAHSLITATWDGLVETIDLDKPKNNNTTVVLDCQAAGVHMGEGTGRADNLFFLAVSPGESTTDLDSNHLSTNIFHAFKNQ